jgi:crotonobetaine/carnitine-CoA ligase
MCALEADASLVMTQRFSASRFWDMCKEKGVTAFNYQGGLLMMLFRQPERVDDADNPVRRAFGAPCPIEIWESFEARFGLKLVEVYGSTEVAIATQNPVSDCRIGTAGRESSLYEVRIVDEDDIPVPSETPGEIVVRPKHPSVMMSGYFDMPEATVAAWRNLWFHTGDRGRMDSDGFLTFIDRMKDCVRRRGENISSFEVEAVINLHEAVLESAVYGVPSELGEEEVMVAVVREPEVRLTPAELLDYCQSKMAHFAIPRFVRWVDELPKTPSERVEKYKLRQEGITAESWDREAHDYVVVR